MSKLKGRSLELYFIDGKPDGMLTATVPFQWTGHMLKINRNQLSEALKRKEASRTGVYLLFGETEDGPLAYIGEGEEIGERIKSHAVKKDWWTSAVLITDTGDELNKALVKYLEARLVQMALDLDKISLENSQTPPCPSLSEAAIANMEGFLENILTVLPAIRIDSFSKDTRPSKATLQKAAQSSEKPVFNLKTPKNGVHGEAILEDGDFIVLKGSRGRKNWVGSMSHNYRQLFESLLARRILKTEGDLAIFTQNYAFPSPSAAGAMLNGRATNGQVEWKLKGTRKTYREWEAARIGAAPDP